MAKLNFLFCFVYSPKDFRGDPGSSRAPGSCRHGAVAFSTNVRVHEGMEPPGDEFLRSLQGSRAAGEIQPRHR